MLSFPVNTTPPLGHFEVSLCHKVKPFIKRSHLILVTVIRLNAQVPSNSTFTKDLFSNDGGEGKDNVKKNNTCKRFGTFEFENSTSLGAKHCDVVESESKSEFKNEY